MTDDLPRTPLRLHQTHEAVEIHLDGDAWAWAWTPNVDDPDQRIEIDLLPDLALVCHAGRGRTVEPAALPGEPPGLTLLVSVNLGAQGAATIDGQQISEEAVTYLAAAGLVALIRAGRDAEHGDPVTASPDDDWASAEAARLVRVARSRLLDEEPVLSVDALIDKRVELAGTRGNSPIQVRSWVQYQRDRGRLVTITTGGVQYVPLYQLDDAFSLRERAAAINVRLHEAGFSEWAAWDWWTVQSPWVEARPVDLLEAAGNDPTAAEQLEAAVAGLLVESG
ncbi:hypothetical protein NHL50_09825 [Acidimicrobiia bacterium EGI L10123]|uniref:hypothetical protein n=1 Tax=Salinilacustrithrix flava TaxID=2957203 RepID=UPI003D7C186A|nr:hypothetical protein [Acidimicrobiia bacterium EGI L10123]